MKIFEKKRNKMEGLYDPRNEHDSCGLGFIANIKGRKSNDIIQKGIFILENLEHRGATGADPLVGDGAGMLTQIPHEMYREEMEKLNCFLPDLGGYGVGMFFFPKEVKYHTLIKGIIVKFSEEQGIKLLGWRDIPVNNECLSKDEEIREAEPIHVQGFFKKPEGMSEDDFERNLYVLRKKTTNKIYKELGSEELYYAVSLSSRTVVYKGMFLADQLAKYYSDLQDVRYVSALALVHQRFSTNTFPSWRLAHPYRMVAHNGEINTSRGNVNWMAARQAGLKSHLLGENLNDIWPITREGQSDTASFDNAIELLYQGGYPLQHASMMLIPEAWAGNPLMDRKRKSFYEFHASIMEPWDGPAAIAFTDGKKIGATLDRNGLRPARYFVSDDDTVVLASEAGTLPVDESKVITKWRLQPGKMLLIDMEAGKIITDEEVKANLSNELDYESILNNTQIVLEDLESDETQKVSLSKANLYSGQKAFGYTQEDLKTLMSPMAVTGQEAIGSMGTDTPISAISNKKKLLYTYFKQNFAQVTNPPIDPIREESVMSLVSFIGPRPNIFDNKSLGSVKRLEVKQPILTNEDMQKIRKISEIGDNHFVSRVLDTTFDKNTGYKGFEKCLENICIKSENVVREGGNIIVLSDRQFGKDRIALPALLAIASVHHHLIRKGLRTAVGLVVESAEPREVHHFAVLAGYGAEAINPYMAFDTILDLKQKNMLSKDVSETEAVSRYIKSVNKGLLKVMSKMGISTYQSYCGAQIFDAVGLSEEFVSKYFKGTSTQISGIGINEIAKETITRHEEAYSNLEVLRDSLDVGGDYAVRKRGEVHAWNSDEITNLQHAVRSNSFDTFKEYSRSMDEQEERLFTIRGLFRLKDSSETGRNSIKIDEVEPAKEIVKRFATGAMSYGSISAEAHENLAIAMNRIEGKSNTGEGGEEVERFSTDNNGDNRRSAIKQVASGRFGVTPDYLASAEEFHIKMAQGSKPGEGGQLPGFKVTEEIAKLRHSTPGVTLISPPPHHDIYSIEDLAQLIYDLKQINPKARIGVKLVASSGVGTIAAGVAKAKADIILISGHNGGTGATPQTSVKYVGIPWEMGLTEANQVLTLNNLRHKVTLRTDGGIKTGRDVVIAAMMGAEEYGVATTALVAMGCIMVRQCHSNTCPVGVCTQDEKLREKFTGTPDKIVNLFTFIATEVREILAELGFKSLNEIIGRTDLLMQVSKASPNLDDLDLNPLFVQADPGNDKRYCEIPVINEVPDTLDQEIWPEIEKYLDNSKKIEKEFLIKNTNRAVGTRISHHLYKKYGYEKLNENFLNLNFKGSAGQSFGAFALKGLKLNLKGDANDYVGKGLSGATITIRIPDESNLISNNNTIIGNTVLYGATSGKLFAAGQAGDRFAVRNSGAITVIEGCDSNGCEYMTGGTAVILGDVGDNFAAGMTGGMAFIYDKSKSFDKKVNPESVVWQSVETDYWKKYLRDLVKEHFEETESFLSENIIKNFDEEVENFVQVCPKEMIGKLQYPITSKLDIQEVS